MKFDQLPLEVILWVFWDGFGFFMQPHDGENISNYKGSILKGGMTIPNIRSLGHGTCDVLKKFDS